MMEPSSLERSSLEAHVDLCALRYQSLDHRLNKLERSIGKVETMVSEVHEMIETIDQRHNERVIGWGISIIGAMAGIIGWLVVTYVVK